MNVKEYNSSVENEAAIVITCPIWNVSLRQTGTQTDVCMAVKSELIVNKGCHVINLLC